jgi:large subunit ribosomal protein L21
MFAVIRTGGKQYKVAPDDVIAIERIAAEPGSEIELGEVLMLGDGASLTIGSPLVDGARVAATVLDQNKADKVIIFKKKRRQGYHRLKGHRQLQTVLRITEILAAGQAKSAVPSKAKKAAPAEGEAKAKRARAPRKKKTETEENE